MPRGLRGWMAAIGLGFALAPWGAATPAAWAAPPAREPKVLYHKSRSFRIPFNMDEADRPRIKEVQLYVSTDGGATWRPAGKASPDQPWFTYRAPRDGEYWIAVRTLDTKGRLYPLDDAAIEPNMKVIVDTVPPVITLASMGRRGSRASVRWELRDENLNPRTLVLEYQAEGAGDWGRVPLRTTPLIGAEEWDARTAGAIRVRATVEDKAGNRGTADLSLTDGLAANPGPTPSTGEEFEPPPPITSASLPSRARPPRAARPAADDEQFVATEAPPDPSREAAPEEPAPSARPSQNQNMLVASPKFALQYAVDDAGESGPALVELWITRDGGHTWTRLGEDPDRRSPFPVDLGGEGTFGLWLSVQSASGLGDQPPAPGDRPQQWVEVDSTAPTVQLDRPQVGIGKSAGKVKITWRATDPHLSQRPIVISYRPERADAPWLPVTDRMENTGSFVWTLPANAPARFHIRVDAYDTLGNRGSAETTETGAVLVDRTRPRGRILGLDQGALGGVDGKSRR